MVFYLFQVGAWGETSNADSLSPTCLKLLQRCPTLKPSVRTNFRSRLSHTSVASIDKWVRENMTSFESTSLLAGAVPAASCFKYPISSEPLLLFAGFSHVNPNMCFQVQLCFAVFSLSFAECCIDVQCVPLPPPPFVSLSTMCWAILPVVLYPSLLLLCEACTMQLFSPFSCSALQSMFCFPTCALPLLCCPRCYICSPYLAVCFNLEISKPSYRPCADYFIFEVFSPG